MSDEERGHDPERERPRPRVVDRRVTARTEASETAAAPEPPPPPPREPPPPPPPAAPPPETAAGAGPVDAPPGEPLWTPEQEAEARRLVEEIGRVPASDWVAEVAVRLANVAGVKIDQGNLADAQLAIDALAALVNAVGPRLGQAEAPLRQTVAQLQLAYAQSMRPPGR